MLQLYFDKLEFFFSWKSFHLDFSPEGTTFIIKIFCIYKADRSATSCVFCTTRYLPIVLFYAIFKVVCDAGVECVIGTFEDVELVHNEANYTAAMRIFQTSYDPCFSRTFSQ